ncbi:MAG: CBS domain-containing protein [Gammaproteobacteria bacterium]|nr:MAG: CBS domain-containing protein [Gammaproteobacteria bacterium]
MTARWSAGGDVGLDVLERVQRSLTVGMIMTPRDDLMTCRSEDTIAAVMLKNSMDYSFLPVVDGSDRYLGLFDAGHWFRRTPPDEPIGDSFEAFSEDLVIGADASIFEFVMQADERPTRLVVSGHKVAGLISISDLQQLPVRAALFTLITGLEIAMAKRIEAEWPDDSDAWKGLLSGARRADLEKKISEARQSDNFVSEIALTQLCDKSTVIYKGKLVPGSRKELKSAFRDVEDLRNNLAHANYYAETPEAAKNVCSVVRSILEIKTDLLEGIEQKRQEKEAAA